MSKVIVVDDDPTNVGLIKMLLELDGFSITACTDIEEAKAAATEEVSAFIVDCNLARDENGIDLLRDVRGGKTAASEKTVVIMTSGDYRRDEESREAGADRFFLKPYSPGDLSSELSKLLARGTQNG